MSNQFSLLKTRRFLPIFVTQFLGALNDNFFKQSLVLLVTFHSAANSDHLSTLTNLAAMLFILPFFLFSSTAGQLSDKFEKSQLAQYLKLAEIGIMSLATIGFFLDQYVVLFTALFLMGAHSTFFGPIKYGILPQLLATDELVGGNALFEMGTSLAILFGMIFSGILMSLPSNNVFWISFTVLLFAIFGYFAARNIPKQPISQANIHIDWNIIKTTKQTISYIYKIKPLFFSIIGISWFWYYGATFLTQIPQFTKQILHGTPSVVTLLLTIFSIGIAVGSLFCERLTGHKVSLKLVPLGAIGLTVFAADLYFSVQHLAVTTQETQTIAMIFANASYYRILFALFGVGLFGGFYIVPLYAFMQANAPETHRARVIAANNIMNALFMVISSIFAIFCLTILKLSLGHLFLITSILSAGVSLLVIQQTKTNEAQV